MIRITSQAEADKCAKGPVDIRSRPFIDGSAAFEVQGAGTLVIGQHESRTGTARGLSVSVSWSRYGYAAGVMDRSELIALRDYLNDYLNGRHQVEYDPVEMSSFTVVEHGTNKEQQ